jgi:hypothetical protein
MNSRTVRGLLLLFSITLTIGLLFQNCSPVEFKSAEDIEGIASQASKEPLLCADGEISGTIKWDIIVGQTIEEPGQCSFGGNLTMIYEKIQKSVCENGKYEGKIEFKKGKLLGQKGGCNCDGGITHGMNTWKLVQGQTLTDQQACPVNGTLNLIYEKQQKYSCDNAVLTSSENFQRGNFIRQEGACMCADGSGEGSSQFRVVPNAIITEPGICTFGGNLQNNYEKLQKFTCQASQSTAQNEFIKGKLLNSTGACNCEGGIVSGAFRFTVLSGQTISESVACKYNGNLVNIYQKQEKQLCTSGNYSNTGMYQKGAFIRQEGACNPPPILTESFTISATKTTKPLDMVWVVDNSGSMSAEAANVRNNITAFISGLDKTSDMKLMLISQKGTSGTTVSLPGGLDPVRFLQANIKISSTGGPKALIDQLSLMDNEGQPFFRADAKKIIVFVTDDNSAMPASTFTSSLSMLGAGSKDIAVFGFIGLGSTASPCQANTGTVYQSLATQTNAKVFNICALDWKQHFSDLKADVLTKLGRTFMMKDSMVAKITKVEVDGVELASSKYNYFNGALTLADDVVMTEQSTIKVYFTQD